MYITRSSNIPVPKVHMAFTHKECTYIVMERIHSRPIGSNWDQRSEASKMKVLADLRAKVEEMRKLSTASTAICSVTGGSLYDPRMPTSSGRFGPFQNVHEFHDHLRNGTQAHENHRSSVSKLIELHRQQWAAPTFTHGDLSSLNIFARGDDVAGIIDWETAGWYPSYWEYTTACQVNPQNVFWRDEVDKFLDEMPEALAMEQRRQRYFGDY